MAESNLYTKRKNGILIELKIAGIKNNNLQYKLSLSGFKGSPNPRPKESTNPILKQILLMLPILPLISGGAISLTYIGTIAAVSPFPRPINALPNIKRGIYELIVIREPVMFKISVIMKDLLLLMVGKRTPATKIPMAPVNVIIEEEIGPYFSFSKSDQPKDS